MSREPNFDELIDAEMTGEERQRLQHVHDLLLQAGPPPELTPELRKAPTFGVVPLKLKRRVVKRRALFLLAATLSVVALFAAGYAVGHQQSGKSTKGPPSLIELKGTPAVRKARATLEVWHSQAGNWPMQLSVVGLPKLPAHRYYEVYLVRDGRPWGSCGRFRVEGSSNAVTVSLTAPYSLRPGDSWVVTRSGPSGSEPGKTVLAPVSA